ncbi:hypothetical protein MKW98_031428 [Papaver atlanticum]|uniref:Uncharacterized protein n=1 Tax=Papaver atlanticum TaxID=357466 RepID=A0AAD4S6K2_9MAGN|nr:hypothetical protein MKW98_031428 [Papaver atlanticum]
MMKLLQLSSFEKNLSRNCTYKTAAPDHRRVKEKSLSFKRSTIFLRKHWGSGRNAVLQRTKRLSWGWFLQTIIEGNLED